MQPKTASQHFRADSIYVYLGLSIVCMWPGRVGRSGAKSNENEIFESLV